MEPPGAPGEPSGGLGKVQTGVRHRNTEKRGVRMKNVELGVVVVVALTMVVAPTAGGAEPVPMGHPDFYPTAQRPIGWRGDGTGAWPGAKGVAKWNAETGENIAWRAKMPGAGMAQPIVIGEKVITTADPNLLVCLNVHNGEILWQTAVDHTAAMTPGDAVKARKEIAFFAEEWKKYTKWCRDCEALAASAGKKGFQPKAMWEKVKQTKILAHGSDNADLKAILADKALKAEWDRLVARQNRYGYRVLTGNNSPLIDPMSALARRWQAANKAYDIWFADNWEGFCTWSFATPVSDGTNVYVTTANNAVASVDLKDGRIKWLVWEHRDGGDRLMRTGGPLHTRYVASPLLVGTYLVVNQNGEIRAYDKRTGKKTWGIVNPYERLGLRKLSQFPFRPTPESPTPCHLRVPLPDGEFVDVIADGGNLVLRLEDGKVLSTKMPYMAKGASPIGYGNHYLWTTGADRQVATSGGIVKLTATDRDSIQLHTVWSCERDQFGDQLQQAATSIAHDGRWYSFFGGRKNRATSFTIADGKAAAFAGAISVNSCSPILVGNRIYSFPQGSFWKRWTRIVDGRMKASVADLDSGKVTTIAPAFIDHRIFEDEAFAERNYQVACGGQITNASPSAQANRIFHRTKGYLWCIGDPKQRFPVPPNCPPQGRLP